MDIKKLFLKTQMNLLNWGLAISFFYSALIFYNFTKIPKTFFSTSALALALILLISMILTRFTLRPKLALLGLGTLLAQLLLSIIDTAVRFKETALAFKAFNGPKVLLFFSLFAAYAIYFLGIYLYYKVYKATRYISELKEV